MSDSLSTSRTARESLARGLNALQADPTVPTQLVDLAAPIAQAMGALHQLERTNQVAPHAATALKCVQDALGRLQTANVTHPAVASALEAVALSLSLVHTLVRSANGPAAAAAPVVAAASAPAAGVPSGTVQMNPAAAAQVRAATANMPARAPSTSGQPAFPTAAATAPVNPHAATAMAAGPMVSRDPFAAPAPQGPPPGAPQGPAPGMAGFVKPMTPSMPVPAPPPAGGNMQLVPADLGAHSPTNFYKGLSGNDIIDHGGLFVSTYVPPKIGTPIRLKVSLPGGYEFEANAVVKWTREQGGDAPPGFGAQFTAITTEARQLVYRYVRNREPLFYDDF